MAIETEAADAADSRLSLISFLDEQKALVSDILRSYFVKELALKTDEVRSAAVYSLMLPSKRLRPIFCLETCRAFGEDESSAFPAAAALECVHSYSLVHDDLPAMDDDDIRRGQPTNHVKFGEARAILAGDGLLTKAFEILATKGEVEAQTRVSWAVELSRAAGMDGMVLGQDEDMANVRMDSKEDLEELHRKKTGALLAASVAMGGISAGVSEETLNKLRSFAMDMGLAFQIQDDVLDVEGGSEIGKPTKSDEKNQKTTYVSLLGLDGAKREGRLWYDRAIEKLESLSLASPQRLLELTRFVIERRL